MLQGSTIRRAMQQRYHTEVTIESGTLERFEEGARRNQLERNNPAGQCTRSECGAITAWRVLLSSSIVNGFGISALKPSFSKSWIIESSM